MKYKFLDEITSDVVFEAYGKDLKELFTNAAEALSSVICKIKEVEPKVEKNIEVSAESVEELMINWLQELIAVVDVDELFLSKFEINEIDETHLKAVCHGEQVSPAKGETVVKAVTYYKFRLEQTKTGFKATVSLDI